MKNPHSAPSRGPATMPDASTSSSMMSASASKGRMSVNSDSCTARTTTVTSGTRTQGRAARASIAQRRAHSGRKRGALPRLRVLRVADAAPRTSGRAAPAWGGGTGGPPPGRGGGGLRHVPLEEARTGMAGDTGDPPDGQVGGGQALLHAARRHDVAGLHRALGLDLLHLEVLAGTLTRHPAPFQLRDRGGGGRRRRGGS